MTVGKFCIEVGKNFGQFFDYLGTKTAEVGTNLVSQSSKMIKNVCSDQNVEIVCNKVNALYTDFQKQSQSCIQNPWQCWQTYWPYAASIVGGVVATQGAINLLKKGSSKFSAITTVAGGLSITAIGLHRIPQNQLNHTLHTVLAATTISAVWIASGSKKFKLSSESLKS